MGNGDAAAPGDEAPATQANEHMKAFFLTLAAKGKDAWYAWRHNPANKGVPVTFAGVDFCEGSRIQIDFSGFDFGAEENLNFSGCKWCGVESPDHPNNFERGLAFFKGACFGRSTNFTGAIFRGGANFTGATFFGEADYTGATFGSRANFLNVQIIKGCSNFTGATFGDGADFTNTTFRDEANFDKTHFEGNVAFNGQTSPFHNAISFAHARFDGEANFSGRRFERTADFTNARFYYPPDFDGVSNAGKIDFTGAHVSFVPAGKWFHWTTDTQIPVRLRAFRKVAEETKNHDLERDLYIEERKAERCVYLRQRWEELKNGGWRHWPRNLLRLAIRGFWTFIMFLYWALADYGRNPLLPFFWLVLSVPFFYCRYKEVLASLMHSAGPANADRYNHAVWMLAFGNAVPFVGPLTIDAEVKKFLFCPGFGSCLAMPPGGFQVWLVVQNIVSIILVFFIGVALRNYFKIK
jgi:uncharacterized protein YjbI with pentapeptide repeats